MVKRPGVLIKVQMLNLLLGVGVFSLLPIFVLVANSELHCRGRCRFNFCPKSTRITQQMQMWCLVVFMLVAEIHSYRFNTGNAGIRDIFQRKSRRLRSQRRKSRSVPEGRADFPAAIFITGKCLNLGRDSICCCRKIGEEFSSSVEICRKTFPARNFGQPQPSRVF